MTQERNVRRALEALQRLQEKHTQCSWTIEQLALAKQNVVAVENKRDEFRYHDFRSRWSQKGDRCTKEFFHTTRSKKVHTGIRHLKREDGSLSEDPEEMRSITTDFFCTFTYNKRSITGGIKKQEGNLGSDNP